MRLGCADFDSQISAHRLIRANHEPPEPSRTPSFLPFLFWKKEARNTTNKKNKDLFVPTKPLKSLEKKRKKLPNSSQGKETRNSKKNRERKDMELNPLFL